MLAVNLLVCLLFGILSFSSASHEIVNSEDFNAQLADAGDNIVLAAFTAVWCGPCRFALPAMQQLEVEFPNVVYLTVDINQQEDIGRYFHIRAVPTFIVLRNSQKIVQELARNERQLRELIQRHIN